MLSTHNVYMKWFFLLCICLFNQLKADPPPAPNWVQLITLVSPPVRDSAAMAFDPISGKMVLFGGIDFDAGTILQDTWAYDASANTWIDLTPSVLPSNYPSERFGASMVFDAASHQIIMFGGTSNSGFLADTWAYNASTNTWTELTPISSPSARTYASLVFSPTTHLNVLFGGQDVGGFLGDTWTFDSITNTWEIKNPTTSPDERSEAGMAFDPISNRIILFGGNGSSGFLSDTWAYNVMSNDWVQLTPTTSPSARSGVNMNLDLNLDQIILFGGLNNPSNDLNWKFDASIPPTWTQLAPATSPSSRSNASMDFDSIRGRMILFGGLDNNTFTDFNDTWALITGTAPHITSANAANFAVGIPSSFTVTTTGFPNALINDSGLLPTGITFVDNGNGTATLSGTPAVGTEGSYALSFTASNGVAPNANQSFTLTIELAPTITSANTVTFVIDTPSSFTVTTTGFPFPLISESGDLPVGMSFIDNGDGTATLSGTPAVGSAGTYFLTFTAVNGVVPNAQQDFTLIISQNFITTTTTITTFPKFASVNQPVTITAHVEPASATGSVTFYDGTKIISTVLLNQGTATLNTTFLQTGSHIIFAIYNGEEAFLSSTSPAVNVVVEEPLPPQNVQGIQKKLANEKRYVNVLTWQAPLGSVSIVGYRIYRDQDLQNLVGVVLSTQELKFKVRICNPNKTYKYYIVSFDQFGNVSLPVLVKIKGNGHCFKNFEEMN